MKILIWAMARALGDGVVYSGCPREIKKIYPDAQVDLFCTRMHAAAFKGNPYVDNIYYFKTYNKPFSKITRTKIYLNPLMQMKNLLKARKEKYDIVIDVDSSYKWQNRFMVKFIMGKDFKKDNRILSGKFRKNNKYKYDRDFLGKIYTNLYDEDNGSAFSVIFDNHNVDCKYELFIPCEKEDKVVNYYKNIVNGNKIIIFNGEGSKMSISSSKIIETLNAILKQYPKYYVFIIGYKDYYDKYKNIIDNINNQRLHITYKTDILDTFALIKHANLLISVDTALIHIASAVGTNVCEIISYGMDEYLIGLPVFVEYALCANKEAGYNINGYSIDEVMKAIEKLI